MTKTIDLLKHLPDTAKDIRLGLEGALTQEGSQGLTEAQIWGVAVAVAATLRQPALLAAIEDDGAPHLGDDGLAAAHTAAALMGMTNIYYHTSFHLLKDDAYKTMPAGIRMNAMKKHGYDAVSYELFALGASVIGKCGNCINAHDKEVKEAGISHQGVQSVVRLASYLNGAAIMLDSLQARNTQAAA